VWPDVGNLAVSKHVFLTSHMSPYTSNTLCSYGVSTGKYLPATERSVMSQFSAFRSPIRVATFCFGREAVNSSETSVTIFGRNGLTSHKT
jgi:hypothetical protein